MDDGALDLIVPDWPAPARVRSACTTRRGGVSRGPYAGLSMGRSAGDAPEAVAENRRRVSVALGLPAQPRWIRQVHGTTVARMPGTLGEPDADASYTTQAGVVCVVQAADCLPVLFCDRDATTVGAAHSGWRGLAAGILEATIDAMPVPAAHLMAWLGPAIGPEAFEVGAEVRAAFLDQDPEARAAFREAGREGKYFADLFVLARRRLARAGVGAVYGGGVSTHADPDRYFSFRRDGATGRMAALIWMEGQP